MPTTFDDFEIVQGTPVEEPDAAPLLPLGSTGTVGALRTLTHPDSDGFPPIAYQRNPDITSNLLGEVVPTPIAATRRTLNTTIVTRFEGKLSDVVVEEVWQGSPNNRASMPTYFLKQLYNYLVNPPVLNPSAQTYIVWRPRDESDKAYNVELFALKVGGGNDQQVLFFKDFRLKTPSDIQNGLQGFDVSDTGLVDQPVTLSMHIVSEVAP